MVCNTGLHRLLASCRIGVLLLGLLAALPAFSQEQFILQVVPAKPFPDLKYLDTDGKAQRLSNNLGKLTIVHFWATWCDPCIHEYPQLNALQLGYADRGLKVVAISMDGLAHVKNVRKFYQEQGIKDMPPYFDNGSKAFRLTKARGLPTSFFVDANGMKIAVAEGPVDWHSKDMLGFIEFHLRTAAQ